MFRSGKKKYKQKEKKMIRQIKKKNKIGRQANNPIFFPQKYNDFFWQEAVKVI